MYYVRNTETGLFLSLDPESDIVWCSTPERAGGKQIRDAWAWRLMVDHFTPASPVEMVWVREENGWEYYASRVICGFAIEDNVRHCLDARTMARWEEHPEMEGEDLFVAFCKDLAELTGMSDSEAGRVLRVPTNIWMKYCRAAEI